MKLIEIKIKKNGIGGSKSEEKSDRIVDKFERKRNRLAERISKATPEKGQKLRDRISQSREEAVGKLKKLKEKNMPLGEYASGFLKSETETPEKVIKTNYGQVKPM